MINPLGNIEEYDRWGNDFLLNNYYKVDYLRENNYKQIFNLLDQQKGAQKREWEDWTTALNDYNQLTLIVTTDQDL